jgi:ribosomal protein S18 acetylase RimI-like enzyme
VSVTDTFVLLSAPLSLPAAGCRLPADNEQWGDGDIARAAVLLRAAYPQDIGRNFAPNGTPGEWLRYVTALVNDSPCGTFSAELTRVIRDEEGVRALALVTRVAPATAHLAQLAVRPDARRQGIARRLVEELAASAAAAGCRQLTLLVAASNAPAWRLYESLGFQRATVST